jgi:putative ABC transport system permease protein
LIALLPIAFRNLLRARRRTLLSGGTMALGTAALVLGSGLSDGIARQLTDNLVAVQTGHLQVVVRPDDFVPQNSPFDAYGHAILPGADGIAERIARVSGVRRAVPFLYGRGTAIAGNRSTLASIVGILPGQEPELRGAHPVEAGTFLPADDPLAAYASAPVARKLRLSVGDPVSFVIQTPKGAVNSMDAVVCGIFAKSAPWYDGTFYVPLAAAQALFDAPGGGTNVKVLLDDGSARGARRARREVAAAVGDLAGLEPDERARVETFDEAGRFSFSIIQANRTALAVLSSFLFLAAAVGIVNSMLMSVHERTREIGTVRALGMRRASVVHLFVLEGLALGIVAAAIGIAVGGAVVLYWARTGIEMNTMTLAWMAGGDRLFPRLTAVNVAGAAVAITTLSTLAAVYPALTASRLQPREALHHI